MVKSVNNKSLNFHNFNIITVNKYNYNCTYDYLENVCKIFQVLQNKNEQFTKVDVNMNVNVDVAAGVSINTHIKESKNYKYKYVT